jgi:hypothetical protein
LGQTTFELATEGVQNVDTDQYLTAFAIDAMLCDSVAVADGKLYIHGGGWNTITPDSFPTQLPRVGLAVLVSVPYTGTNENHKLGIQLQDQDGRRMALGPGHAVPDDGPAFGAMFNVGRPPMLQRGDPQPVPFAVNIDGLPIDVPGAYSFVLTIDDKEIHRLRFRVAGTS